VNVRVLCSASVLVGLLAVSGAPAATPRHVPLTVSITGRGTIRLSDGRRLACSSRCRKAFSVRAGAKLSLTARPGSGWAFVAWGGACRSGRATCTLRPRRANGVAATFAPPGSTRANPIPLGQDAPIADGFRLKVVSVTPDAQLGVPPAPGGQNFVVLLTVTYVGGGKGDLLPLINNLDAAGTHGGTYTTYENGCHAPLPPPALGESGFDIFSGQSVTGNICWQIVGSDAGGLVLFIGSGFTHTTWFALR
jgi:hypothetical protein